MMVSSWMLRCSILLFLCGNQVHSGGGVEEEPEVYYEYSPYDGWYNNLAHPSWGAADTQLYRRVPPVYSDGTYEPAGANRPNPIEISDAVLHGETGSGSYRNKSAFLVFFGQQVVEEILDAQRPGCPPEYFNIKIPKGHAQFDPEGKGDVEMPFLRSRYDMTTGLSPNNPRQQLNEITPFIDGGLVYGPNKAWADALRLYKDGLLASTNDTDSDEGYFPAYNDIRLPFANPPPPRDHTLKPIKRFFKIGNPRGNENPFLLAFGVMWFRYHNYQAVRIKSLHNNWSDEKIFNEARKWTIAIYQKIVIYDWLPSWLGHDLPRYDGYDPSIQPNIAHEFQTAAMRFGHTMVPPAVYRRGHAPICRFYETTDKTGSQDKGHKATRTCNSYWNPQEAIQEILNPDDGLDGVATLLLGMASQKAEREDNIITPDLRGNVFGPLDFSRRDLMALNIQRARDHGVPDYNSVRMEYGLDPIEEDDWQAINPDLNTMNPAIFSNLTMVYKNVSKIDLWVGGILESGRCSDMSCSRREGPGELFRAIILDQFKRIRDGDRFWYQNSKNGLFTKDEISIINNTTVKMVVMATNPQLNDIDIQDDPFETTNAPCPQPVQLSASMPTHMAGCTFKKTFDYFEGSSVSYILSFGVLGVILVAFIALLFFFAKRQQWRTIKKRENMRPRTAPSNRNNSTDATPALEWVSHKSRDRQVLVTLDANKKQIIVKSDGGKLYRIVDCTLLGQRSNNEVNMIASTDKHQRMLLLKVPHEYDLILKFDDSNSRDTFRMMLRDFFTNRCQPSLALAVLIETPEKNMLKNAVTKEARQNLLDRFFRVTAANAFHYDINKDASDSLEPTAAADIANCELTRHEFAEALGMKPTSLFVENMFNLVDNNNDGFLSFREFLDVIIIFSKGSAEDKAKMLFNMYDLDQSGYLSVEEFKSMLRSLLDLANETVEECKIDKLVDNMYKEKFSQKTHELYFEDFMTILNEYKDVMNYASLELAAAPADRNGNARRENIPSRARKTFHKSYRNADDEKATRSRMSTNPLTSRSHEQPPKTMVEQKLLEIHRFFENYRLHIFWVSLYTLVSVGIFVERAYYYSVEREHAGLRRIAGYGVTVTRGAASGMMFTYSTLLVTMCRNMITYLRETPVNRYMPLDAAVSFHKFVAWMALVYTAMHIIGHSINFYHISTQTANDLSCLFRNFFHATDELPKFHYWAWQTITGFTGILLTVITMVMYIFAIQYARRNAFRIFWITHNLYIPLFTLMILHGAGRLVQPPFMHYFLLGPAVLFTIDKLISMSRKKVEIPVIRAELLPSDVTYIEIKKPQNFEYKSGQWVRISCPVLGGSEYHPFTISSAPHEPNLSFHIRAVGPWTMNLRQTYDPSTIKEHALPKLHLDGPYGEGHQEWFKYDVSILVGGGIGVTPFASIIKDLAHRSTLGTQFTCKKVYFIWVTRTQKQFEWMTDIIRQVEESDNRNLLSCHIFVTQFREKFDIRTTMLYICERHFQKISNRSLFTGLRSITHFGRPDFTSFLKLVSAQHQETNVFGVFSCGPPPMTLSVEKACTYMNKYQEQSLFAHHFENF